MKITQLRTTLFGLGFRNSIIVELLTDAGLVGLGETVLKRHSKTVEQHLHELGRYLVGQDPLRIEDHHEKMYRDSFWVGGPMHASAISAVDMALWDLQGKALGVPVYQLLGGPTRDSIPAYCHCPAGETPEAFAANLRQCREWGYRAAKTTLPLFYGRPAVAAQTGYSGAGGAVPSSLRETEWLATSSFGRIAEFFAAGREAVGPDFELALDCHGRLSPANAIRLCRALEPFHLLFIEEPVPPEDPQALAEVAAHSATPIAAGERLATIYGVRPFLDARSLAILQPDVCNCGGLTAAKKIAALAESHYVSICPHNPNGPVATAASLHLLAAIPNCLMLETIGSPADYELHAQMAESPNRPSDGRFKLPAGPGLGITLRAGAEQQLSYQPFKGHR
ncbi:MAG TPA: mandelate racemase/muconate lactonizing enzyme family protein [Pirellulales bacterium]|jgi:galactonate dehydratase|nr:mandelate racemase/muconate lactonizing enzyme family protein [Pirellulales bacterium]